MDQRQADDHTSRLMAHDLLQSVAIIQSILGVVRAGNRSADRLAVDLSAIETEVQVMARRLHATLDAAERAEQFDVRRVAQRVIERIGTAYTGQIDLVSGVHAIEVFGDWLEWERALLNLMENSAVGSPMVKYKCAPMHDRDFTSTFSGRQMAKDLDLILECARAADVPAPLAAQMREMYTAMIATGSGDDDYIATIRHQENLAGLSDIEPKKTA